MQNDKNYATLKKVQPKFSPGWDEINGKIISTWNLGIMFTTGKIPTKILTKEISAICTLCVICVEVLPELKVFRLR